MRTISWSSTINTLITHTILLIDNRDLHFDFRPFIWETDDVTRSAEILRPFFHVFQAIRTCADRFHIEPFSIIDDTQDDALIADDEQYVDAVCFRMAQRVGNRFLDDAEKLVFDALFYWEVFRL